LSAHKYNDREEKIMSKTAEIIEKLKAGVTARELVTEGYRHGMVYALRKKYSNPAKVFVE
jgi:hypothetical protein